jgi:hypothetical protein
MEERTRDEFFQSLEKAEKKVPGSGKRYRDFSRPWKKTLPPGCVPLR